MAEEPGTAAERPTRASRRAKLMLWIGGVGTGVAALCCFTPIAVIALGAIGAGTLVAYLDIVLYPVLLFFVVLTVVAYLRWSGRRAADRSA